MIAETLRRVRFAPILTATVLTILLLLLVRRAAEVLVLLFIGILISLYLRALTGYIERRFKVPDPFSYVAALAAGKTIRRKIAVNVVARAQPLFNRRHGAPEHFSFDGEIQEREQQKQPELVHSSPPTRKPTAASAPPASSTSPPPAVSA